MFLYNTLNILIWKLNTLNITKIKAIEEKFHFFWFLPVCVFVCYLLSVVVRTISVLHFFVHVVRQRDNCVRVCATHCWMPFNRSPRSTPNSYMIIRSAGSSTRDVVKWFIKKYNLLYNFTLCSEKTDVTCCVYIFAIKIVSMKIYTQYTI